MFDFNKLESSGWEKFAGDIYRPLKSEMQGNTGFIRTSKQSEEAPRKTEIFAQIEQFENKNDISNLDEEINQLASNMLEINDRFSTKFYYDHISLISEMKPNSNFPIVTEIGSFINSQSRSNQATSRLLGIVARVVNESLSQANKSNAGEAGENIVRAILAAAGLKKDVHFREQYKSKKGSDTDFVFPNVPDETDQDVEAFVAVQMSSNDRTRLITSELKQGATPFVLTGNGLSASKKKLRAIGNQIILDQKSKSTKLVCYQHEITREIERLKKHIQKGKTETGPLIERLDFFENYTLNFQQFAEQMRKKFLN